MKKTMALLILFAGGLFAAPRVTVGIGFGAPAPVVVAQPPCPGPGYTWVDGYYAPSGVWVAGYWAPPVAVNVRHVAPVFHARVIDHRFEHFRR